MKNNWSQIIDKLEFAFQPIIHSFSGKLYAVEALLRNVENASNVNSPHALFDLAFEDDYLYSFDLQLREKAIKKFASLKLEGIKLFYNLDNRIIYNQNYTRGNTEKILNKYGLDKNLICFELSEKGSAIEQNALTSMIQNYNNSEYCIAIDDFGVGVSGLKLLYFSQANIIKIDRFFISNIHKDSKKKLFCQSIIDMAHVMGMKIVAEGVETIYEFYACKNIGADFIQGFYVQKPTLKLHKIKPYYEKIAQVILDEKRSDAITPIDEEYIIKYKSLNIKESLYNLFIYFKNHPKNSFVPVIDDNDNLIGAIYEVDIKEISYSQYGLSLAKNKSTSSNLKKFIKDVISVEISWGIDKTLEVFNHNPNSSGIFITKANKYVGFIDLKSLLILSHKRNIQIATNLNPLTKLPGNQQIEIYLQKSFKELERRETTHILYFDFNNFKPFNDYYGFRQGDRAILLFSELLQKHFPTSSFIAHVGGDDYFIGLIDTPIEIVYEIALRVLTEFKDSCKNFYNEKDKEAGFIIAKDRYAEVKKFNLLSCACAIIEFNKNCKKNNFDHTLNILKKESKKSPFPVAASF